MIANGQAVAEGSQAIVAGDVQLGCLVPPFQLSVSNRGHLWFN
jgi:hypothetical protein